MIRKIDVERLKKAAFFQIMYIASSLIWKQDLDEVKVGRTIDKIIANNNQSIRLCGEGAYVRVFIITFVLFSCV